MCNYFHRKLRHLWKVGQSLHIHCHGYDNDYFLSEVGGRKPITFIKPGCWTSNPNTNHLLRVAGGQPPQSCRDFTQALLYIQSLPFEDLHVPPLPLQPTHREHPLRPSHRGASLIASTQKPHQPFSLLQHVKFRSFNWRDQRVPYFPCTNTVPYRVHFIFVLPHALHPCITIHEVPPSLDIGQYPPMSKQPPKYFDVLLHCQPPDLTPSYPVIAPFPFSTLFISRLNCARTGTPFPHTHVWHIAARPQHHNSNFH